MKSTCKKSAKLYTLSVSEGIQIKLLKRSVRKSNLALSRANNSLIATNDAYTDLFSTYTNNFIKIKTAGFWQRVSWVFFGVPFIK